MKRLIDTLPGVFMSVDEVTDTLSHMWDTEAGAEGGRMDFRASQMNLILHFGLETSAAEALEQFNTAIVFAQKYPCRLVVLCPYSESDSEVKFEGKLFSQCYIGKHLRDVCCCEALILGYSPEQSDFLENQVSIWLESDLPIYHWLHRVPAERISKHYLGFFKRCRRVLYDGSVEGDVYDLIEWPDPDRVIDLTKARSLPLRQHLGQFISRFSPSELVDGLQTLNFRYSKSMRRMAMQLMGWHKTALSKCFDRPADIDSVILSLEPLSADDHDCCLRIDWQFADAEKTLKLDYNRSRKSGIIRTNLSSGQLEHPLHVEPLSAEAVLGEALFFG
ncbi:hypothetical protein G0Q06_04300 [Puniceicoccales bacterium CK1056]|uniref:Glucose-6-phosphate dehydrogenase assembly protein OpcA N-terminal domain-containing protein n=1 Tax=Oceanipulchritudo coccoides TaxID=2706888 RepID=A0A6B2M0G7_9BACT|nr:glucose-6-phosphate dehydrogenase assembly protein OpcA [Oceanipulchritudo coccoides]NDV61664.1 hypothetical protein [Oceanipulchritudo coccoides]